MTPFLYIILKEKNEQQYFRFLEFEVHLNILKTLQLSIS
jgi:hypothetical protein